jgi:hypothetical protein
LLVRLSNRYSFAKNDIFDTLYLLISRVAHKRQFF